MTAEPSLPPTADRVAAALATRWLGRAYEWHPVCSSTSDLAAERARAGAAAGLVIAADAQTGGRGRLGRSWHSPAGENLYLSLLLRPARPAAEIPPLTLLAGAAVARALAPLGVSPRLKWPNDVQLVDGDDRRRKLAGVLTEMASAGERVEHVVVGVGVNVNATALSRRARRPRDVAARRARAAGRPRARARRRAERVRAAVRRVRSARAGGRRSRRSARSRRCPNAAASTIACRASRWASIPTAPCACATTRGGSTA